MKVRFSDKTFKPKAKNKHLERGTFVFHIIEAPGCTLTMQGKRRMAVERAMKEAPGCTFRIEQIG